MARGSWNIDEGIQKRWIEKNLDDRFKEWWQDPTRTDYPVLHDGEARPSAPGPYCVYEVAGGTIQQRSTGKTKTTEQTYDVVPVQFRIHAKTRAYSGGTKTGKQVAKIVAGHVADAFDPGAGYLDLGPDKHIYTFRQPDLRVREGDQEWSWTLVYDIYFDAEYAKLIKT